MGRGQEGKDPFTEVLGTRRGLSPKLQTVALRTSVWQEEMRQFLACWDLTQAVSSEPWEVVANSACRALEDLDDALRSKRGRGVSMRDVSLTYEERYQSSLVSLFDVSLGSFIITDESPGDDGVVRHAFAYSPDHFLIFDDDADGELTFVPLLAIPEGLVASPDLEQVLANDKEARRLCQKEVGRRLKQRIKRGPSDLYDAVPEPMQA